MAKSSFNPQKNQPRMDADKKLTQIPRIEFVFIREIRVAKIRLHFRRALPSSLA